jgi:prophage regulatory protein
MNPNERIIRLPQVLDMVGLKKSAIYKKIKAQEFPAPIKLGAHASGWLESAIQQWIAKQAGQSVNSANDERHRRAA